MTSLLTRAGRWLVAPPAAADDDPASPADALAARVARATREDERVAAPSRGAWLPPATVAGAGARLEPRRHAPSDPVIDAPLQPATATATAAVPARLVALGPPDEVLALAAAVALRHRARSALVLVWAAGETPDLFVPPVPAWPAARLVARRLARRGIRVVARGRLVWVALPAAGDDARALGARAEAAADDLPSVLAVMGPRDGAGDAMLAGRERAVVAGVPGSPFARLVDGDLPIPADVVEPPAPGLARLAALGGLRG
jgi:hypothetical protein